ncbi:Ctk3p NDAI_0E00320 [Naumovozyma dairenensis CBS 421]|uniref:CTD kinase subunit gamma Ctk3 C-terminal domain-containing protein n=1 Tax=Naumovozyma dairenensis (strain ATCC 10597 / BCRC 20456 / CBS 421 / NBRC 0211 / NRRL Y-12639) TaxID=1071378 RepID=G0WAS8_NAUDC|nr:hypothetical protein NDAI_0E00320 [Naumovozyma dairenensis CBS 421]CCD24848.1 hypothetical protein NDAI_0E00320 [Naumovozyma dairenensis CBS 421]
MDSFEARLQFIQVLKNLQKNLSIIDNRTSISSGGETNPMSSSSTVDPIQFYLRSYKDHFEDFHQCLFDTTNKMNSLDRLNVLFYYSKILITLRSNMNEFNEKVIFNVLLPSLCDLYHLILPNYDWKSLTNLDPCIEIYNLLKDNFFKDDELMTLKDYRIVKDNEGEIQGTQENIAINKLSWYSVKDATTMRTTKDKEASSSTPSLGHSVMDHKESFINTRDLLQDRILKRQLFFKHYIQNGLTPVFGVDNNPHSTLKDSDHLATTTASVSPVLPLSGQDQLAVTTTTNNTPTAVHTNMHDSSGNNTTNINKVHKSLTTNDRIIPIIIRRMENDRERHKRLKEKSWVVDRNIQRQRQKGQPLNTKKLILNVNEFESLWNNTNVNKLTIDDIKNMKEMNLIAKQSYMIE